MSNTTELAKTESPGLPELYTPITSTSDLQMPGIYLIADMSQMARERVARPGDVVLALGSDDSSPIHLIDRDKDAKGTFTAYVLARDPFVASTADNHMEFLPKDYVRGPEERDVWNGYFYYLALPEIDPVLPARMMLWRTAGMPVARKINTFLMQAAARGDNRPIHVEFGVTEGIGRASGQKYWKLTVKNIPHDEETLDLALVQQQMLGANQAQYQSSATEPDSDAASY